MRWSNEYLQSDFEWKLLESRIDELCICLEEEDFFWPPYREKLFERMEEVSDLLKGTDIFEYADRKEKIKRGLRRIENAYYFLISVRICRENGFREPERFLLRGAMNSLTASL